MALTSLKKKLGQNKAAAKAPISKKTVVAKTPKAEEVDTDEDEDEVVEQPAKKKTLLKKKTVAKAPVVEEEDEDEDEDLDDEEQEEEEQEETPAKKTLTKKPTKKAAVVEEEEDEDDSEDEDDEESEDEDLDDDQDDEVEDEDDEEEVEEVKPAKTVKKTAVKAAATKTSKAPVKTAPKATTKKVVKEEVEEAKPSKTMFGSKPKVKAERELQEGAVIPRDELLRKFAAKMECSIADAASGLKAIEEFMLEEVFPLYSVNLFGVRFKRTVAPERIFAGTGGLNIETDGRVTHVSEHVRVTATISIGKESTKGIVDEEGDFIEGDYNAKGKFVPAK